MYNLDAYIADFLLENKKLSAQGLGEFTLVDGQAENGAPKVQFIHDKSAYTSDELVSFIAEQQGKNKIVTGFDVESHLNQIKQFINIGTPWTIPGLGQLQLGKSREYEFVQQTHNEHALHERNRRKQAATDANYQTYNVTNPATARGSNIGTVLLTLFIILALGVGGYYFYTNRSSIATAANTTKDTTATITDTSTAVPLSSNMNNTATTTQPPAGSNAASPNGSVTSTTAAVSSSAAGFRFVLSRTSNAVYALKRFSQLKNYGAKVYMDSIKRDTSSVYKIYLVKNTLPSDTARVRDSLTKYYGKPVRVEAGQ